MSPSKSIHLAEIKIKLSQQKQLRLVWNEINKKSEGTVVSTPCYLTVSLATWISGRFHLMKWDKNEETSRISKFRWEDGTYAQVKQIDNLYTSTQTHILART